MNKEYEAVMTAVLSKPSPRLCVNHDSPGVLFCCDVFWHL